MRFKGLILAGALMTALSAQAETFEMHYQIKGLSKAIGDSSSLGLIAAP